VTPAPRRTALLRRARQCLAALFVAILAVLATGVPASAHAELVSTDPEKGSVVEDAPDEVTLTFSEPVRLTAREVAVYDAAGRVVDSETTASGTEVTVALPGAASLADGSYVVGWYVVSVDGHPISGSLTFSVGRPSEAVVALPEAPESPRSGTVTQALAGAATYLGILLALGLAVFLALVLPTSYDDRAVRGRLRRITIGAAVLAGLGAALQVPLASLRAQGLGLGRVLSSYDATLVGNEVVQVAVLVVGAGVLVSQVSAKPPVPQDRVVLVCGGILLALAPAIVGHTRAYGPQVAVVAADALHVAAGAMWFGGLVGLVLTLRPLAGRDGLAAETLARFSVLAGGLLLAVASAGSFLGWRILGSWSALVETTYGRLVLAKVALVLVVVAVAAWNRFGLLPRVRAAGSSSGGAASLVSRTLAAEAALLLVLLGVTGFLANQSPRITPAAAASTPAETSPTQSATVGWVTVEVTMEPRHPGRNTITVRLLDDDGAPAEGVEPQVHARHEGLDLGELELSRRGDGEWEATEVLPRAGTWEVQVSIGLGRFERRVTTLRFEVADQPSPADEIRRQRS
jgi:copper transport protein